MREIENYLSQIFNGAQMGKWKARDIREELRCHLIDSVEELTEAGLPKDQSVRRAIEQFGEPEVIAQHIEAIHAKRRLKQVAVAVSILLVAAVGLAGLKSLHQAARERNLQQVLLSEKRSAEPSGSEFRLPVATEQADEKPEAGEDEEAREIELVQSEIAETPPMRCLKGKPKGQLPPMMVACMTMMVRRRMDRRHDSPHRRGGCCPMIESRCNVQN